MNPHLGLLLSAIAFVATHFLLSHPLRDPLVRSIGTAAFRGLYSVIALVTFGLAIYCYRISGREPQLWTIDGDAAWIVASLLMWFGSILFVGSFVGNPALVGARGPTGGPHGVLGITRHPMMWGFAIWAGIHIALLGQFKTVVLDGAIIILALAGAFGQDRKKARLMGEAWHEWTAQTAFVPFTRGFANPGAIALVGGTLLFLAATWLHPIPAGFWRWIG